MTVWEAVAGEGARLKREQLEREIAALPREIDRANLSHTMSKLFMFLSEDLERALREAGRAPITALNREALAALRLIDEFAWTSLEADSVEARDELNRRVSACRAIIAHAQSMQP